jgi:hypothetical protein
VQFDVMSRAEIDAIRKRSKSADDGPWVTDYAAMAIKTVVRRLFKFLPVSIEMQSAVSLDEMAENGVSQQNSAVDRRRVHARRRRLLPGRRPTTRKDLMSDQRIYVISPKAAEGEQPKRRLVRAPNQAQAVRHCAKELQASVATQDELVELVAAGVRVEDSGRAS